MKYPFSRFRTVPEDGIFIDAMRFDFQAVLLWDGRYTEMAEKLAWPLGTVKSRLHRARAKLVAMRAAAVENNLTESNV